ncbi:hypothetical protein TIFTF001_052766 [Ficus carica]|uniref:Uncharacterized protein n=1 Tax=Ficus carica TaxID=3494 RepID=A0AA88JHC1_FICCA|nr:hypothetical protein TIFTF001_052766 [Ficus carica]
MDKARGNRPLEEDVIIPASIDLDESDAEDDKLTSVIRSSREKYDPHQNREGTKSNNEASYRSQPATVSGPGALSIPFIARLSRTQKKMFE